MTRCGLVLPLFHPWFCDDEHVVTKVNSEVPLKYGRVIFCPVFPNIRIIVVFQGYQVPSPYPDKSRIVTRRSMKLGLKDTDTVRP
jgi:hypothetical protein